MAEVAARAAVDCRNWRRVVDMSRSFRTVAGCGQEISLTNHRLEGNQNPVLRQNRTCLQLGTRCPNMAKAMSPEQARWGCILGYLRRMPRGIFCEKNWLAEWPTCAPPVRVTNLTNSRPRPRM